MRALRRLPLWAALAGALAVGCSTVDLGDPPADVNACRPSQDFFANGGLWDMFLDKDYNGRKCSDSSCHAAGAGRPLSLKMPEPGTPVPLPLPPIWMANYISATEQMQCSNVHSSPLLTNPSAIVTHGGGMLIKPDGPEATLIEMWVTAP